MLLIIRPENRKKLFYTQNAFRNVLQSDFGGENIRYWIWVLWVPVIFQKYECPNVFFYFSYYNVTRRTRFRFRFIFNKICMDKTYV